MIELLRDTYTIILDDKREGVANGRIKINRDGALLLAEAYEKLFGKSQTADRREERGGICWLTEIDYFKRRGVLDQDFDYRDYLSEPAARTDTQSFGGQD